MYIIIIIIHNDCSRNWVFILVGVEMVCSLSLKDDRVEQCLRSCGSEFQMWGPRERAKAMSLAFVLLDFQHEGLRRRA